MGPDALTYQLLRKMNSLAHERMVMCLTDPRSVDVIRTIKPPLEMEEIADHRRFVALMVRLMDVREKLWKNKYALYEKYNLRDDEMVIVCPAYDLPWPSNLAEATYWGMHFRVSDDPNIYYHVAPVDARFGML